MLLAISPELLGPAPATAAAVPGEGDSCSESSSNAWAPCASAPPRALHDPMRRPSIEAGGAGAGLVTAFCCCPCCLTAAVAAATAVVLARLVKRGSACAWRGVHKGDAGWLVDGHLSVCCCEDHHQLQPSPYRISPRGSCPMLLSLPELHLTTAAAAAATMRGSLHAGGRAGG